MFLYRLALEHGIWDVEAWKQKITLGQVRRWMAYWRVEPFGDQWRRAGRAALVASGGKVEPSAEEKFLPSYKAPEPRQMSDEEQMAELMSIPAFAKQLKAQGY